MAGGDVIIMREWERFVRFLKERGGRITETRRIVFVAALKRKDHFRADDLVLALSGGKERVSRGSVYRALSLMVEFGILRQLRDGDAHHHYEAVLAGSPSHEHMVCEYCGRFLEFSSPGLSELLDEACRAEGFVPRMRRVTIMGVCSGCAHKAVPAEAHGSHNDE